MTFNSKVRIIRRAMKDYFGRRELNHEMFSLMDGSGECGKFFWEDENERGEEYLTYFLNRLNVTFDEYVEELRRLIPIEDKFLKKYPEVPYDNEAEAYMDLCAVLNMR